MVECFKYSLHDAIGSYFVVTIPILVCACIVAIEVINIMEKKRKVESV